MKSYLKVEIGIVVLFVFLIVVGAIVSLPANSALSSPNIAISWSYQTVQSITDQYGIVTTPNSGNVYVEVNMTITNNGYSDSFSTNPLYFNLVTNNIQYTYDTATFSLAEWNTISILNGGTYSGIMVFQVPSTASSFTMSGQEYTTTFSKFNIIWTQQTVSEFPSLLILPLFMIATLIAVAFYKKKAMQYKRL